MPKQAGGGSKAPKPPKSPKAYKTPTDTSVGGNQGTKPTIDVQTGGVYSSQGPPLQGPAPKKGGSRNAKPIPNNTPIEKAGGAGGKYETTALKQGTATKKAQQDVKKSLTNQKQTLVGSTRRGGSTFSGGAVHDVNRASPGVSRLGGDRGGVPITVDGHSGVGTRVGGGFQGLVGGNSPGAPAFFDSGGGGGGGGESGGNPLNAGVSQEALKDQDLESILHGAKKRGRIKYTRGTE